MSVKRHLLTRRRFLTLALAAVPGVSLAGNVALDQTHLRVSRFNLRASASPRRFVHISDLHYRGDSGFADSIITAIHKERPDFVCFSGDLVDTPGHLAEALEIIRGIGFPVFGIPGNHDHACANSFHRHEHAFAATGGAWLMNRSAMTADGLTEIVGLDGLRSHTLPPFHARHRIVLTHFPVVADRLAGPVPSLVLAGHSHGGQIRIPFVGPLFLPYGVGAYDHGLFKIRSGPLHVSAGLGTSTVPVRINCRPEITVFEI